MGARAAQGAVWLALALAGAGCAKPPPAAPVWMVKAAQGQELLATLRTSQGEIVVRLFSKDAPKTVENFVGLATGEKEWVDPRNRKPSRAPLYDGTEFHRVIPGFMIQGGDPNGDGTGKPGFVIPDEFQSGRTFDKPGLLAMANAGPNTNGCQFFITTSTPANLNGRHTIFGEVLKGYDVVERISQVPRGERDRPETPVEIEQVLISDKAP
jgi:peptidyl-prolyl cis-trans isomerase A (cyclophilin A)